MVRREQLVAALRRSDSWDDAKSWMRVLHRAGDADGRLRVGEREGVPSPVCFRFRAPKHRFAQVRTHARRAPATAPAAGCRSSRARLRSTTDRRARSAASSARPAWVGDGRRDGCRRAVRTGRARPTRGEAGCRDRRAGMPRSPSGGAPAAWPRLSAWSPLSRSQLGPGRSVPRARRSWPASSRRSKGCGCCTTGESRAPAATSTTSSSRQPGCS